MFTDVRPGEAPTAILMFANVFLILCAYYFIKPLREGWIAISPISGLGKMEVKAYSSFGQTLVLIPIVRGSARLPDRSSRATPILRASLFPLLHLPLLWSSSPGLLLVVLAIR